MKKNIWIVAAGCMLVMSMVAACGSKANTENDDPAPASSVSVAGISGESTEPGSSDEEGDTNGGDFALTGQKWEWIYWDGDRDGEEEQISFEYVDLGDEAEKYILATLEVGGSSETNIDRAGRIVRIFDKEDEKGPYLLIEYNYENRLTEKADMQCILRLRNGELIVEASAE